MKNSLKELCEKRSRGEKAGIPSYCSANKLVLEVALERAKAFNRPVLIEATANQVNQFGGYTGMKPQDFMDEVKRIAKKVGCSEELLILAGDHLGPLTWCNEPAADAMQKAEELVYLFTKAGYTKIHLDTSMKLGDDSKDSPLDTAVIAERGLRLYKACMKAYEELLQADSQATRPVFIIGSEVPIPGGATEAEEGIRVTEPEDFSDTVKTYRKIFAENGEEEAWKDIIAVVVQPGVEFGDAQVFDYDSEAAKSLCEELKKYPEIGFEGHSTDYQSRENLKKMVEDGIYILKVGPALTFGLREALFLLSMIEKELIPETERSNYPEVLEEAMLAAPENWQKHYHGTEEEKAFARKYSFSDRSRYYTGNEAVEKAMNRLFENLDKSGIPLSILHQYMPIEYSKIRAGDLKLSARELAKNGIARFMEDYEYATG